MCHRHYWFSSYGLKAWKREMSTLSLCSLVEHMISSIPFLQHLFSIPTRTYVADMLRFLITLHTSCSAVYCLWVCLCVFVDLLP